MRKRGKSLFREYFELIAETAVFVFFVMTFVVQAFQIPTGSMIPKLLVGDFLLVNKMAYARPSSPLASFLLPHKQIDRKDLVVFKWPVDLTKDLVKRVIGLGGIMLRYERNSSTSMTRPSTSRTKSTRTIRPIQRTTHIITTWPCVIIMDRYSSRPGIFLSWEITATIVRIAGRGALCLWTISRGDRGSYIFLTMLSATHI